MASHVVPKAVLVPGCVRAVRKRGEDVITSDGPVRPFIIATPTKCGTTTLEEMCRRHRGGRAQPGLPSFRIMDWEKPRRQHRMALPDGWGNADRYLMVRNPYTRYMSMFEYLRAPHNYSKFGAREIQGREWRGLDMGRWSPAKDKAPLRFEQFLYWLAAERLIYASGRWPNRRGELTEPFAYRSPWVWLDSLTDSRRQLRQQPGKGGRSVQLIRLERIWDELITLKKRYDLRTLSVKASIQANRTLTYVKGGGAAYWGEVGGCAAGVFNSRSGGEFRPAAVRSTPGCECAACVVGVAAEATKLGYAY